MMIDDTCISFLTSNKIWGNFDLHISIIIMTIIIITMIIMIIMIIPIYCCTDTSRSSDIILLVLVLQWSSSLRLHRLDSIFVIVGLSPHTYNNIIVTTIIIITIIIRMILIPYN
jgi:hypothetical protein